MIDEIIDFLHLNLPAKTRSAEMLRPEQFLDRSCIKLKVSIKLLINKHHRVRNGTLDEIIMEKWNLN